ncbi:MAG: hypothetical protein KDD10_02845 [Phaeodactylibacter sp.]|nr:hypothetical protein [Phaeodactylibacter sp.]MCB9292615.1 hypothetical protein [Lewinellaceae bacterium]
MKAGNSYSVWIKVLGGVIALPLLLVLNTSFQSAPSSDGYTEKAFKLDNFAKEVVELEVTQPGNIIATAEWHPGKAELALILFGPGQMNYYRRSDGGSPLELKYAVKEVDNAEGSAWRVKLVNQSGEAVEGVLRISYPEASPVGEAEALQ